MKIALALTAALAATVLGAAPANADDVPPGPVTVTWPEVTAFNPTQTPWEFTVSNSGEGHLFYSWGGTEDYQWDIQVDPIPESGVVTMDFSDHEGQGVVRVWSCTTPTWTTDDRCTEPARSPEISAYSHITLGSREIASGSVKPGPAIARIGYGPQVPGITTSWALVDDPANPTQTYASGTLAEGELVTNPNNGISQFPFTVPEGLASGDYYLRVHMAVDTEDFGHLEGDIDPTWPEVVHVDSTAPRLSVRKTPTTIYPANDDYLDYLRIEATTNEPTIGTLEVTNATGALVFRSSRHHVDQTRDDYSDILWSGRNTQHKLVAEGTYKLSLTVADPAGNTDAWTSKVKVSHKRLTWVTYSRKVSAQRSLSGKPAVGACSTLAKRRHGALGFYSQTKCHGSNARSVVATNQGAYIPKAFQNHYRWVQISLNGGPATRSPNNYIVMGYLHQRTHKFIYSSVFRKGQGPHRGHRVVTADEVIFDRSTKHPFVIWSNGLTAGSRYDVRSYTVQVRYQALR